MTTPAQAPAATYVVEPAHSSAEFAVKHMMIATVRGRFEAFDVVATVDEADFANSSATVRLRAESIDTRNADRDGHLRSADFLDAENHPELTFVTRHIEPRGSDWKIVGDLTVRGVTRELVLQAEATGPVTDPWGGRRIGVSAQGKFNRKDFGMVWNAALETGGFLVADEVKLNIELELLKK